MAVAEPRDAATLIVIANPENPRVLMGRRGKTARFMPGVYVFPGGVTEKSDRNVPVKSSVSDSYYRAMQAQNQSHANSLAITALRETFEETGLLIGFSGMPDKQSFEQQIESGSLPELANLYYLGRAVTPAFHKSRFHARFFVVELPEIVKLEDASDELEDVHWVPLMDPPDLPFAPVTQFMLDECRLRFNQGFQHQSTGLHFRWEDGKPVASLE